jgi:hypothetical protein
MPKGIDAVSGRVGTRDDLIGRTRKSVSPATANHETRPRGESSLLAQVLV